jgi:hypothetical protein
MKAPKQRLFVFLVLSSYEYMHGDSEDAFYHVATVSATANHVSEKSVSYTFLKDQ